MDFPFFAAGARVLGVPAPTVPYETLAAVSGGPLSKPIKNIFSLVKSFCVPGPLMGHFEGYIGSAPLVHYVLSGLH